jgi:hypothetical protein
MDERLKLHPLAKKTWEEYNVAAMLLGYRFSRQCHAFFRAVDENGNFLPADQMDYCDADTLLPDEVNTFEKRQVRRNAYTKKWNILVSGP